MNDINGSNEIYLKVKERIDNLKYLKLAEFHKDTDEYIDLLIKGYQNSISRNISYADESFWVPKFSIEYEYRLDESEINILEDGIYFEVEVSDEDICQEYTWSDYVYFDINYLDKEKNLEEFDKCVDEMYELYKFMGAPHSEAHERYMKDLFMHQYKIANSARYWDNAIHKISYLFSNDKKNVTIFYKNGGEIIYELKEFMSLHIPKFIINKYNENSYNKSRDMIRFLESNRLN